MPNLTLSTTVLLPGLVAAAIYGVFVCSFNNGLMPNITAHVMRGDPNVPGADVPLKKYYTGIGPIDQQLVFLQIFFWPITSGSSPRLFLQGIHFVGQTGAFWAVMVLEAMRTGNQGRLITFTTIFGLLFQNISLAVTIPIWGMLYLLTKRQRPTSALPVALSLPTPSIAALPPAVFLGLTVPSMAMALPAPDVVSHDFHQIAIALWQPFPLWISLAWYALRPLFATRATTERLSAPGKTYAALTRLHVFALTLAVTSHVSAFTLSFGTLLAPSAFAPHIVDAFEPLSVFLPRPTAPGVALPLNEGILRFLQWDEAVSCAAALVWAGTVYRGDTREKGSFFAGLLGRSLLWTVVGGPAAAVVALVWARDEVVLCGAVDDGKEKEKGNAKVQAGGGSGAQGKSAKKGR
ncbi:uncharacterized protein J3D65DRAFT_631872 [Phyllosticta citribraziliensis]|uniref:Uncharacterized protein n=1 Tax=Phyllosticta citribraziliensis TaxID=989973 RepID=A0ABR1LH70_9PEZI